MDKVIPPIPSFYACYLLRSIARHSSLYVGSTPNPARRLKQHNGDTKGGAARTSKLSLRPWEMTCLVTGFPSKTAALQFEWAWQNPNLTRHVDVESRITESKMTTRISPRTGRTRKRPARPRLSLTDRLANLHLLLQSNSFQRWPLKLTFYGADVFRVWQKWTEMQPTKLRIGIDVALAASVESVASTASTLDDQLQARSVGIRNLDVSYLGMKSHLEKSQNTFSGAAVLSCVICDHSVPANGSGTLVCPSDKCSSISHIQCLSSAFLKAENNNESIVPTHGNCPGCGTEVQWVDLAKDLSLRVRGEKEMKAIFKPKRGQKTPAGAVFNEDAEQSTDDEDMLDLVLEDDSDLQELSESNDEEIDGRHTTSVAPGSRHQSAIFKRTNRAMTYSEPVIDDSDWENAEVLT